MQTITVPRSQIWYNKKHRVSSKVIGSWMKYMMKTIGIDGSFSGKSGRTSVVSRLARANVPVDVGMTVTGHRNVESYKRYDKTVELKTKAAMKIVCHPFNADGSRKMYSDVYEEELAVFDSVQKSGNFHVLQHVGGESSSNKDNSLVASLDCEQQKLVPHADLSVLKPSSTEINPDLTDTFLDTVDLELVAGNNPKLREALNLNLTVGSTSISGGVFNNCIIVPGGGKVDIASMMKQIYGYRI